MDKSPSPCPPNPSECTPSPQVHMPQAGTAGVASPFSFFPFPIQECTCATCKYYEAALLCHYASLSPNADAFMAYNAQMSPYACYGHMPSLSMSAPSVEPEAAMMASLADQFDSQIGSLTKAACTSAGRSMLQSVMRLQQVDKVKLIFDELMGDCETVMLDPHGCHVVRSLIEVIDSNQVAEMITHLDDTLVLNMCTLSQYTRRILQALFERHPDCDLQYIVDTLSTNAQYLSATQQGCISLMRVFERCNDAQKNQLASQLMTNFCELACDPYANYVIQCIVEHSTKEVALKYVSERFTGNYLKMSCNKFASNVMEKVVQMATPAIRRVILDELVFNPAALQQMVQDGFGNFVIQSIIETSASATEYKKISDRLRSVLSNSPYGHKIESRLRNKRFSQKSRALAPEDVNRVAPTVACS